MHIICSHVTETSATVKHLNIFQTRFWGSMIPCEVKCLPDWLGPWGKRCLGNASTHTHTHAHLAFHFVFSSILVCSGQMACFEPVPRIEAENAISFVWNISAICFSIWCRDLHTRSCSDSCGPNHTSYCSIVTVACIWYIGFLPPTQFGVLLLVFFFFFAGLAWCLWLAME